MSATIDITGRDLDPATIVRIARYGAKVALAAEALNRIEASRKVVDDCVFKSASRLQWALMPVPKFRVGLPTKLCDIAVCRLASAL